MLALDFLVVRRAKLHLFFDKAYLFGKKSMDESLFFRNFAAAFLSFMLKDI